MKKYATLHILIIFCACFASASAQDGGQKRGVAVYVAGEEPAGAKGSQKILGAELVKAITNSDTLYAVDRTEAILKQIDSELIYQRSGAVSDSLIKSLGKQFSVQYLCIADISAAEKGTYYIEARLVDVETAVVLKIATAKSNLKNAEPTERAARQVARELIAGKKEAARQYQAPPAGAASGQIVITSTPNGAAVEVNGKQMGVTPLTFTPQSTGSMAITVSMPGYEPSAKTIGYGGGTVSMPFVLKKAK